VLFLSKAPEQDHYLYIPHGTYMISYTPEYPSAEDNSQRIPDTPDSSGHLESLNNNSVASCLFEKVHIVSLLQNFHQAD
jgi:hypothetical protein